MNARHKSNPLYTRFHRAGWFQEISSLITISIILRVFFSFACPSSVFPEELAKIHSRSPSYDRSVVCSPDSRLRASPFNFHHLIISLGSTSICLHLFPRLPVSSFFPSIFHLITFLEDSSYARCDNSS
jgi:hypothetical protein